MALPKTAQRTISTLPEQIRPWFEGKNAFIVQPDGTVTEAEWGAKKPTLPQLQNAVGGYIEMVPYGAKVRQWKMVCNEEGLLIGLPPNQLATALAHETHYLVGSIVFTRHM